MPNECDGMELEDLVDSEDLELLIREAERRGLSLTEMAKYGLQQELASRTMPKSMKGTIQAFRRR
ncbi:hypothetical protein [Azotobacter chroococcum]|uniref:hypothetical protein n=1 Tax=Azotobacter chroococcum TaxID=353 RepID=UPI0010AED2C3|nr:hypothetical protein [Azotobacter chroococcum]TKD40566.1 hypothetical protein FCG41_09510 [Azotobacter chroococcum]